MAATTMNSPAVPAVSIEVEGNRVRLHPDEARRVAIALIKHAADADNGRLE